MTLNFTTSQMVESFVQKIHCIPGCYELSFYVNSHSSLCMQFMNYRVNNHGSLCICKFMIQTHERFKRMLISMVESFVQKIHSIPGCYELSFYVNSHSSLCMQFMNYRVNNHGSLCICKFMIQTHERFKRMLIYFDINTPIYSLSCSKDLVLER